MELKIYVPESHWMDRAPTVELRKLENVQELFKKGQVESPILTANARISDIKVLRSPSQQLRQIEDAIYAIQGKIVAGYESSVVIDCGILLRLAIEDMVLPSPLKLVFGDYIDLTTKVLGFYYDSWEGLIHYKVPFKGRVKVVDAVKGSSDISLLLEVTEPGRGIVISPPYKKESKPNPNWHYLFGRPS